MKKLLMMLLVVGILISTGGCNPDYESKSWSEIYTIKCNNLSENYITKWNNLKAEYRSFNTWDKLFVSYNLKSAGDSYLRDVSYSREQSAEYLRRSKEIYQLYYEIYERRLKLYVESHSELSLQIKELILERRVCLSMTTEQVRVTKGNPVDINRSVGSWGIHEQWVYNNQYFYFENGILTSWQN